MSIPMSAGEKSYRVIDFDDLPGVPCPCGTARRALVDVPELPVTVHRTEITVDAKLHYHRRLTETYYVLRCAAGTRMQLDDDFVPVRPGMCIFIPPGVRHRAVGNMTALIIVFPKFDPDDEVIAEQPR
jgi:mannose-6-phosphate isomerase-like protein (cupin superfamily)